MITISRKPINQQLMEQMQQIQSLINEQKTVIDALNLKVDEQKTVIDALNIKVDILNCN